MRLLAALPLLLFCALPVRSADPGTADPGTAKLGAAELGTRTIFDATAGLQSWHTDKGVSAQVQDGTVTIETGDIAFGAAAVAGPLPAEPAAIELSILTVTGGRASVQVEWFRKDSSFIQATALLATTKGGIALREGDLLKFAPTAEKPARFRLKFWLEGRNAKAIFNRARITAPRQWRAAGTTLVQSYGATAGYEADEGLVVDTTGQALLLGLKPGKSYASVLLTDRAAYHAKGTAIVDLAAPIKGVANVQVVCFDKTGKQLKSVDLVKNLSHPDLYEIPLAPLADQFPAGTGQIAFRIWLIGRSATAKIDALHYGVVTEPRP